MRNEFPTGFLWGAATSAYQVEGAPDADGRGPSIWDTFKDAGPACDHYRRWESDVDLMASLDLNAYRFSIAWPRLYPAGSGQVNQLGLDHYDRLVDALLARGIEPVVTLYHWDLPQALQDVGGWRNRDTAERFAEYAATCFAAYGDRVRTWVTQNEPWIAGVLGHQLGLHAPGEQDLAGAVRAMHHLLLSHNLAVAALPSGGRAGISYSLFPHYPASDAPADVAATHGSDGYVNRWFLDPVLRGSYPADMRERYEALIGPLDFVRDGDLTGATADFIGVNYYTTRVMRAAGKPPFGWEVAPVPDGAPVTDLGWAVVPSALTDLLLRLSRDYPGVPLLITENGGVYYDAPADPGRVEFLRAHLEAVHDAISQGAPVEGYFHWSLLDNFEWAEGYGPRFGLVHVDYDTQERTVKDSGRFYAKVARENGL